MRLQSYGSFERFKPKAQVDQENREISEAMARWSREAARVFFRWHYAALQQARYPAPR